MPKKGSEAPDYGPLANVSRQAVAAGERIGRETLDFSREQFETMQPLVQEISGLQMDAQRQQMDQGADYFNYLRNTFRPLEEGIVGDAERFSTAAYQDRMARQAATDAGRAFRRATEATNRNLRSMGVNPNSGRFVSASRANDLGLAANRAASMTGARNQAEQVGYARKLDAAGLGRNLPGASTAAYSSATNAGSQAGSVAQSAGQNFVGGLQTGAGIMNQGYNSGISGFGNILNNQTEQYMAGGSLLGSIGGALGGASSLLTTFGVSDRRLKHHIEKVGEDSTTGLTLYEFEYKGMPGRRFVGVMADEVLEVEPDAVVVGDDGYLTVNYGMLGLEMREVV